MPRAPLCRSLGTLALLVVAVACAPRQRSDPGDLEVRNGLREPIAAIVGGQAHTIPACSTLRLADVELRRVRIVSPTGRDLMRVDSLSGSPIGPRRFIVIDGGGLFDLRTAPRAEPPRLGGPGCFGSVHDLQEQLRDRGLLPDP